MNSPSQNLASSLELIADGQYKDALEALGAIDEHNLPDEEKGSWFLAMGQCSLHLGIYGHTFLDEAINLFRHSDRNVQFAQAKYHKGWQLQSSGQHEHANQTLLEAYAAFLRVDEHDWAARVLNRIAAISMFLGNLEQAASNLTNCVDCLLRTGNNVKTAVARNNLALVRFLQGSVSSAITIYEKTEGSRHILSSQNQCVMTLCRALAIAFRGETQYAAKCHAEAAPLLAGLKREEAQYYEIKGWIALLDNDYSAAEKALKKGLALSLKIAPESTLISQIKRLYADLYVATRKFDKAEKFAIEALEVATKLTERAEIAACHRVFAQVAQYRGDDNKARDEIKQAIDMYSQIGARYELAATRCLAGASGLYRNGERTALLYLAREYFESEDIKHYVQKIDTELARAEAPVRKSRAAKKKAVCDCPTIVAVNPAMKKLIEFADHVAAADMTVLLTGDTGTGKDLMARYIHHRSGRTGPFVPVNAAAVPETMIESELFGHSKGAFTGAAHDRVGLFEQANEGTFYLNEIADASLPFQAKLLQVLETRTVRRIGDNEERPVSFRLIAATNHDLQEAISAQTFRLDLFHRLNEIPLHLPRLGDRREDIPDLVEYFLTLSGIDVSQNGNGHDLERLAGLLSLLPWPGNVRELKARVGGMVVKARGDLGRMLAEILHSNEPERERLYRILKKTDWNRSRAAEILGVSEGTVRNRIRKFDLSRLDS